MCGEKVRCQRLDLEVRVFTLSLVAVAYHSGALQAVIFGGSVFLGATGTA